MEQFDDSTEQNYCSYDNTEYKERYYKSDGYVEGLVSRALSRAKRPVTTKEILTVVGVYATVTEEDVLRCLCHLEEYGHVEREVTWRRSV